VMRKRTAGVLGVVAFALVTFAGWLIAYSLSGTCWDGSDAEGHWVGGCYYELGPIGYIIPLLVGATVAIAIRRRGQL
jgi:hypothetical protein